jgi:hypothetical protein
MSGHLSEMSTHYKSGHHFLAVLENFSKMCMKIWLKNENLA